MSDEMRDEMRDVDAAVTPHRDELYADAAAIAAEYREAGWTAHALEPTTVRPLSGGGDGAEGGVSDEATDPGLGFEVVVSAAQFDPVEAAVAAEDATFDASEVYTRLVDDLALLVVAVVDSATETAVVFPLYYAVETARTTLVAARDRGELLTHLRPGDVDTDGDEADETSQNVVTFAHDAPSLFVPERVSL
ncbi:DUF7529 family protein [Haloarchaeobius sp. DT45]|uniref:DUF7529 family protein n=1 Tax=Haloarchaeobius sp. DT45 TaxID=3446116 RepID=UPI003F6D3771